MIGRDTLLLDALFLAHNSDRWTRLDEPIKSHDSDSDGHFIGKLVRANDDDCGTVSSALCVYPKSTSYL